MNLFPCFNTIINVGTAFSKTYLPFAGKIRAFHSIMVKTFGEVKPVYLSMAVKLCRVYITNTFTTSLAQVTCSIQETGFAFNLMRHTGTIQHQGFQAVMFFSR